MPASPRRRHRRCCRSVRVTRRASTRADPAMSVVRRHARAHGDTGGDAGGLRSAPGRCHAGRGAAAAMAARLRSGERERRAPPVRCRSGRATRLDAPRVRPGCVIKTFTRDACNVALRRAGGSTIPRPGVRRGPVREAVAAGRCDAGDGARWPRRGPHAPGGPVMARAPPAGSAVLARLSPPPTATVGSRRGTLHAFEPPRRHAARERHRGLGRMQAAMPGICPVRLRIDHMIGL